MDIGVSVGNTREKEEYDAIARAVVNIMNTPADQKTIRAALRVLAELGEVKNINIDNCSFVSEAKPDKNSDEHCRYFDLDDGVEETLDG